LAFGAFAEEIVFRGLLLPEFNIRYGMQRGIFLTGIVWSAVHFRSDTYSGLSEAGVLLHLVNRILICLAMNYVFAWMTLQGKSIIPAAIAHSVRNMLVMSEINGSSPWTLEIFVVLWWIIAFALFRFWPIPEAQPPSPDSFTPSLEPSLEPPPLAL
jgi:membrane protease YdiL (CAAX protease family)